MHYLVALLLSGLISLMYMLGMRNTVWFFSNLFKIVGPYLPHHKIAIRNLTACYPHWSAQRVEEVALASWENLGIIIAETIWMHKLSEQKFWDMVSLEMPSEGLSGALIISGHISNFELIHASVARYGQKMHSLYRPTNNPYVNVIIEQLRAHPNSKFSRKNDALSIKALLQALAAGEAVGLLTDQKLRQGVKSRFLRHNVTTTNLPEKIHKKYGYPIYITYVHRTANGKYVIKFKLLDKTETSITEAIDAAFTDIIDHAPEQWLWMHNRFLDKKASR